MSQGPASGVADTPAGDDLAFVYFRGSWAGSHHRGGYFGQDRLVHALLASPRLRRVLIADAPRQPPAILRDLALRREPPFPADGARRHLRLAGPTRSDPRPPAAARAAYAAQGVQLRAGARRAHLHAPVVLTTNLLFAAFADARWARRLTLHLTDDWLAEESHGAWRPAYERAFERIRRARTPVSAVSQTILDRIEPAGPSLVVPNGVDPAEWTDVDAPPAWLHALPRPWLVYTGGLDARIEPRLLEAAAAAAPGASIVLVGYQIDPGHIRRLQAIEGVTVHDQVGRRELAAIVVAADACLIPHRRTPMTEAMSPIKLFEYLAAGRPVAAVDLPPMRGLDERVVLADEGAFGDAVRRALALGPDDEGHRLDTVRRFGWAGRHDALLDFAGVR